MNRLSMLAASAVFVAGFAQGAAAVEVNETVMTTATPTKVWGEIGKFDAIGAWLPGVESSPADKGDAVGSVRVLTLAAPGRPTVVERLTAHSEQSYSYVIERVDPKVLPVANYRSTVEVAPSGAGSVVTWRGTFDPAGGLDDAGSKTAVSGLYRAGLDNIKAMSER